MAKNNKYEKAYDNYTSSINQYVKEGKKLYDEAYKNSKGYVGDEGYQRALELGKKGATSASNSAIAQGINSARAGGMSKAQASAMGNQSAINAYNNQLLNQQSNAYSSGQDAVSNEYNRAGGISGIYANKSNLQGNAMSSQQAEGNNRYNRGWGILGGIGSLLTSDERLKKYKDVSTRFFTKTDGKDSDSIMKYKVDISKYKGE